MSAYVSLVTCYLWTLFVTVQLSFKVFGIDRPVNPQALLRPGFTCGSYLDLCNYLHHHHVALVKYSTYAQLLCPDPSCQQRRDDDYLPLSGLPALHDGAGSLRF